MMEKKTEQKKKNWIGKAVINLLFAVAVLAYLCIPSVHDLYNEIAWMLTSGDFTLVREFVESYGAYAAAVEKITSKAGLKQIDVFFEKHGRLSILIARLLPFISFDIVSYAGG